jgi:O-antigen/teichoic acid export membrane protein
MPLTVEGSLAPERLADLTRRTVRRSVILTTPTMLGLAAGAPLLLVLYGAQYGAASRHALMILAMTALPRGLLQCHWAAMRVVTDGRRLFSTQVLLGVLLLASTWIGARQWGIEGAATGITGSHALVMLLCLPDLLACMRDPAPKLAPLALMTAIGVASQ